MKKLLLIIVLLVASCQLPFLDDSYKTDGIEFSSFEHAWRAIANYKYEISDQTQAPSTTYNRRAGDCLDRSLLLAYYCESMGADVEVVALDMGEKYHAVIKVNGAYFESLVYGRTYTQEYIDKYYVRSYSVSYLIFLSR